MSRSLKYRYLDSRFSEAWDANGDGAGAGGMRSSEGTGEGGDENESNGWITSMLARRASEAMPNIIGAGMLGSFKSNDESGDSSAFSSESESEEDSVAPPPPPPPTVGEEESASPRMKRSSSIDRAKRPSPLLDVSLDGADPMPFINSPSELTPKPFVGEYSFPYVLFNLSITISGNDLVFPREPIIKNIHFSINIFYFWGN